jgi:hypothetical protein
MPLIDYTCVGDYLLPNIILTEPLREKYPSTELTGDQISSLGRYGRMRRAFLKEHRPITYSRLLLSERLFPHLREVDTIANERHERGVSEGIILKEIVYEV